MAWLSEDALDFLRELELNNNREWFEANKKRYESSVKKPMEALAADLITRMRELDPEINMEPKKALFRIHRDTRFSKDKSPYKTNAALAISSSSKDFSRPGLYLNLEPSLIAFGSGVYMPTPEQLKSLRHHIAKNHKEQEELAAEASFQKHFGEIKGEKNKKLPPEFAEAAKDIPLLFNKQFYFWREYDAEEALRDDLPEFAMAHIRSAWPLNDFLMRGLS